MTTAYKLPPTGWYRYRLEHILRELAEGVPEDIVARRWDVTVYTVRTLRNRAKKWEREAK